CMFALRMANETRWLSSKSVMASSFTRATTRSPCAEARAGQSTRTRATKARKISADMEPGEGKEGTALYSAHSPPQQTDRPLCDGAHLAKVGSTTMRILYAD